MSRPPKKPKPGEAFVSVQREFVSWARRSLEMGQTGFSGHSRDECAKFVRHAEAALDALESGNPFLIFQTAWRAGGWFTRSELAIKAAMGETHDQSHDKKAKTRKDKTESNHKDYARRVKAILNSADCPRWGENPNMAEIFRTVQKAVGLESSDTIRKAWESYGK